LKSDQFPLFTEDQSVNGYEDFGQVLDQIEATPEELLQLARASQCEIGPHITRKCFVVDRQIEVLVSLAASKPATDGRFKTSRGVDVQ
jgi:hypothetical protein